MNLKDGRRIIPNHNPYSYPWGHAAPEKIGDEAMIEVDTASGFRSNRRVHVILLEAEDGSLWLVEHPDAAQHPVCRYTRTPSKPMHYVTARARSAR